MVPRPRSGATAAEQAPRAPTLAGADDRAKRLKNQASAEMAKNMARNLVYYAQLLKQHPLVPKQ